jgi:signal transduction histidine kinase
MPGDTRKIDLETKRNVFLMYKEILTNSAKHARADTVRIDVELRDGMMSIRVEDNGIGFDPSGEHAGNGIRNLRSRAAAISGTVNIHSRSGGGTITTISAPLT